jgi:hypothetical protein
VILIAIVKFQFNGSGLLLPFKANELAMNLQQRIDLLSRLGGYILSNDPSWQEAKEKAGRENNWFTPEFIELATKNIALTYLRKDLLEKWVTNYPLLSVERIPKKVGIIMAGNIPLVGFHDWLAVFLSGNIAVVKPSSKDKALIKHLSGKIAEWSGAAETASFAEMLKGCDAYIATGSNNSSRYFDYYFGKYPHIIRRNRTSVALLDGSEPVADLEKLADDVYMYFGLGCRNVTKIYVPEGYDFISLLEAFRKYHYLADHHKFRNNYDYNLAILILNKKYYMTNGSILLTEESALFSPISLLHYEFYDSREVLEKQLASENDIQCIVGRGHFDFGQAQCPALSDFADGIDTMAFLTGL